MAKQYLTGPSHYAVTVTFLYPSIVSSDANAQSDILYIGGSSITAIYIPVGWVNANLAVYACITDGANNGGVTPAGNIANFAPLYKSDGTRYVIDVPIVGGTGPGICVQVNPYDFIGLDAIVLQSVNTGAPGTPVIQTGSPVLSVATIANGSF